MSKPKMTFICPPTSRPQDDIFFPMGPLVLATLLQKQGIKTHIIDFDLHCRKFPELNTNSFAFWQMFFDEVAAHESDYFGISSICSNFPHAIQMAKALKQRYPRSKIILGGPQPSAVAAKTLETFDFIDTIVIGEGERTLPELIQTPWSFNRLKMIKGLAFRWKNQVFLNGPRNLIENLDELPIPNYSLVDFSSYYQMTPHVAVIEAGRGCPWRCNFCSTAEFWSRKYRAKSPSRILEEMKLIHQKFGMRFFCLTHDNFTTSPKYVSEFCNYFIEHNPGFTWASSARTDTLKKRDLAKLFQAGCRSLFYGVDSGSEKTQKKIDKYLDLAGYQEILSETIRQGIKPTASFVIGFPEERPEDLDATLQMGLWSLKAGAQDIQFHRLSPLASTKVHRENTQDLFLDPFATDISVMIHPNQEIISWVLSYPELFSSFYSIPTPHLRDFQLFDVSSFFTIVGNNFGPVLQRYLENHHQSPLKMYEDWKTFAKEKYPPASFQNGTRTREYYIDTFSDFI